LNAGTSNLGQHNFKVIRLSNLARLNLEKSDLAEKNQLEKFYQCQMGHR